MEQPELLGRWVAEVQGQPGPIELRLNPHPEWNGTVKGEIRRPGGTAIVVGDVDHGVLSMEESGDGKRTTGTWSGDVVEGSCAREVRGEWIDQNDQSYRFTLRKAAY